jgi:hypothetical protein
MTDHSHLLRPHASLLGAQKSDIELNPAKWMHERIVRSIIDFEKGTRPVTGNRR